MNQEFIRRYQGGENVLEFEEGCQQDISLFYLIEGKGDTPR